MILQNGCNLNWMQPFLILFCSQCHSALATSLRDFFNSPFFQRNKSLSGFVKCPAGVKYAFGV